MENGTFSFERIQYIQRYYLVSYNWNNRNKYRKEENSSVQCWTPYSSASRLGFVNIEDPQQIFKKSRLQNKNKFVSVVKLEELTFDLFDRTDVLYSVTWFPAPDDVTKRVSLNWIHLHIKHSKILDVKTGLKMMVVNTIVPFKTVFILYLISS